MGKFPEYKREFKYTSEIAENEVFMLLGLPIGENDKNKPCIIGAIFAEEMYFWNSVGKKICVKINSPGGNIIDGFSIMDAIRHTGARTMNVGLAASMAMNILLTGSHKTSYDYAKGMIHPPMGKDKVGVEMMRDSLTTVLTNLSNFSKDQIENMLKEGAPDTWLNAKQMKKHGLIDDIIPTEMKPQEVETEDPYALYELYNSLITQEMADTTEKPEVFADLMAASLADKEKIKNQETELEGLKAKLKAIEDAAAADKLKNATALYEDAVKNKRIPEKPELKDQFVKMALDTPEAFKAMVEANKPVERRSVVDVINKARGFTGVDTEEETYDYLANHNPQRLYAMMEDEPDKYNKIVRDWQEKQKLKA